MTGCGILMLDHEEEEAKSSSGEEGRGGNERQDGRMWKGRGQQCSEDEVRRMEGGGVVETMGGENECVLRRPNHVPLLFAV